jgi:hypothetical protein
MTETFPVPNSAAPANYSYYTVDIVTNQILAEIPFEDVVYERALKGSGNFDGKISINKQTKNLDLYNSTLPGKCALYVVRNGICMWGGIIWGRSYDLFTRSLSITASEFTSYLKHRVIWKTYSYQFTATLTKTSKIGLSSVVLSNTNNINLKIPIKAADEYGNLNKVYVSFTRSDLVQFNNYYFVSSETTPTTTTFSVNIPDLPTGKYTDVSISIRVDTYEYLKELMREASQDFLDTQFANEIIAPGIKLPYQITNKSATNGVVTLTTDTTHSLVPGQNVEIRNVDDSIDGYRVISEVPSDTTFRVEIPSYNVKTVSFSGTQATVVVDVSTTGDIFKLSKGSIVALSGVPNFNGYDYFNGSNFVIESVVSNDTFTYSKTNPHPSATAPDITNITSSSSVITYFTTNASTNFPVNSYVTVENATIAEYNVINQKITNSTGSSFQIANPYGKQVSAIYTPNASNPAKGYIGVLSSSGTPGVVAQTTIAPTNVYTNKYEVSTRALKTTVPYGIISATRKLNATGTAFIATLKLETFGRGFPFIKGDTVTVDIDPELKAPGQNNVTEVSRFAPLTDSVPLSAVDSVNKTISYVLEGKDVKTPNGASFEEITTPVKLGAARNKVSYANVRTEIELGLSENVPLTAESYIYVAGVDGISWRQPVYNGYHRVSSVSGAGTASTEITAFETASGVATFYTAANNVFEQGQKITIAGFTGGNTFLNSVGADLPSVLESVQGSLDGESYFKIFITDTETRSKTSTSTPRPTASIKGQKLVRYNLPEYGLLSLSEPDGTYAVTKYRVPGYKTSTAEQTLVTLQMEDQVEISIGDYINVSTSNPDIDGSFKVTKRSDDKRQISYLLPLSMSKKEKSGDTVFKETSGVVVRFQRQLDQESIKYTTSITHLACRDDVVTVKSTNHALKENDQVFITNLPSALQNFDNNGYKVTVSNVQDDFFQYRVTEFRAGVSTAGNYGVVTIDKIKFTANKDKKSGTIRYTLASGASDHFYEVGTKVTVEGIANVVSSSKFVSSFSFNRTGIITAVNVYGASVKYFDIAVTGLTSAANISERSPIAKAGSTCQAFGTRLIIEASSAISSGSATTTTITYSGTSLPFSASQKITVVGFTGGNAARLNISEISLATANSTTLTVTLSGATASSTSSGAPFAYVRKRASAVLDYSESTSAQPVYGISANSSTQTVTLYCPSHGFTDQDLVKVILYGVHSTKYTRDSSKPVVITKIDNDMFSYTLSNSPANTFSIDYPTSGPITDIQPSTPSVGTVRFFATNTFSTNQKIIIKGVSPNNYNTLDPVTIINRTSSYFDINSNLTDAYVSSSGIAMAAVAPTGQAINAPYLSTTPVVFARSYGEFPENTNIGGLDFDPTQYSGNFYPNTIIRGSDMVNLADHMEQYSNSVNGFNYRIDCSLQIDATTGISTFKRKFVLVPITPVTLKEYLNTLSGGVLGKGQVAPPYAFGADKITFEHPGNVRNVNFSENAMNSATRIFVSGNNEAADPNSESRFSGASDSDLLEAGWPILDMAEKIDWPTQYNPLTLTINRDNWGNFDAEADFHKTAERLLYQSRPPRGDFIIRVNGSLPPIIGTYNPGDWCQLIVDDEGGFVASRLASILEPRKDVILRRIDSIKVSVPNSPAFPEDIDLTLVTDWEVDRIGR